MLIITDLAIALIFTLLIGLFFLGCRRCGPWQGLGWFFMLLFLFTWAGGVWTGPYGPVLWGYYWLPFFIVGIVFALLLAAAVVPRPPRNRKEAFKQAKTEAAAEQVTDMAVNTFFWILVMVLVAALATHYLAA